MFTHPYKSLLLAAFLPLAGQAYDKIGLRFNRTGTDAGSVSVTVVDENGRVVNGAQANVTVTPAFRSTAGAITADMLCFNANANSNPNITFGVNITGLTESITFDKVGVDIHAMNGQGNYQQNNDNKTRQWNVALTSGATAFTTLSNIDIAAGVGTSGSVHKFWTISAATPVTVSNGSLALDFTITKGDTNEGCFFGLTDITIGGDSRIETSTEPVDPDPDPDPDPEDSFGGANRYYHIVWYSNADSYMTEKGGNTLEVDPKSNIQKQYWQFIPVSGKPNVYYIQNAVTKNYIEACKGGNDNSNWLGTQSTPVEYYLAQESAVNNAYRLTSTNVANYDNTSASPVGLNKHGGYNAIITWAAATSNTGSYWYIRETENDYDPSAAEAALVHSDYAKTAQVYFMPCGSLNASIAANELHLTGEGAAKPLDYPCKTWSGTAEVDGTPNKSKLYTMYTTDKGAVIPGRDVQVSVKLQSAPPAGYLAQLCFDWDRDGVFETTYPVSPESADLAFEVSVPATAKPGETRMRFRLTDDEDENPEADVVGGQVLDCKLDVLDTTGQGMPVVSVKVNDAQRGAADVTYAMTDGVQRATAKATALNSSQFCCWLEGRKVVSRDAEYTFDVNRPVSLTAVFGAVTDTAEQPAAAHPVGDVNCDGTVSISDLTALIGYMIGRTSAKISLQAADVDGNSWLDLNDITLLCELIAK